MRTLFYIVILQIFALSLYANNTNKQRAIDFAEKFIELNSKNSYSIQSVKELSHNNIATSYLLNLNPTGFIIISANEKVEPLIGYSFESHSTSQDTWPDQFKWWIDNTQENIFSTIQYKNSKKHPGWDIENNTKLKSVQVNTVSPLLNSRWDQGRNWNMFCPEDEDGPGGRAWVGCVAVSMAQAMYYYKYPVKGRGKASYVHDDYGTQMVNFDNIEPYQWSEMPATSANEHNAALLYHAAVTVNMDFGADGSGAYTRTAASAMKSYFNYSKTTRSVDRVKDDEEWKSLLIDELMKGHPIIYHGNGDNNEPGHAWNIDGVDAQGLFHNNWGWSGSMNGYYNINNLAPGSNDFNYNQGAIIGIKPKEAGPIDIVLSNNSVKEKRPAGTFVGIVSIDDEMPDTLYSYSLKGNPIIIGNGGYAEAKFYIENDSLKTKEEFDHEKRTFYTLFIEVSDTRGNSFEKKFEINIESTVSTTKISNNKTFKVYPNPFSQTISIETGSKGKVIVYNLQGQIMKSFNVNETINSSDLSNLQRGSYIIEFTNDNGSSYQRIMKN
jgi:hypothetical protein